MARTIKGNCTGKAAVIARRDLQEEIFEAQREARLRFQNDLTAALDNLKALDPEGWEIWFDGRPEQTCGEMLPAIKEQVELLRDLLDEKDHQAEKDYAHTCGHPI